MNERSPALISPERLERLALLHAGFLVLAASWTYGGNIWWARLALAIVASFGGVITLTAVSQSGDAGRSVRRRLWWLAPWAAFVVLVIASGFNPSFVALKQEGASVLVHTGERFPGWPSTVLPSLSWRELWLGASLYLVAANLVLVVRKRAGLRVLLTVIAVNAFVLSVFGTLQKLTGSDLYFGAAVSPNKRFFATFLYNNHWGAFMVLGLGTAAGLLFYQARQYRGRDLLHSPFSMAVLGLLIIAISAPLSASRAATLMAALLLGIVTVHALVQINVSRRNLGLSRTPLFAAVLLLVGVTTMVAAWLGKKGIDERYTETSVALAAPTSVFSERLELYRDTWQLAQLKPTFGWGLESYGTAFMLIRSRPLEASRQYETSYVKAHSDWLQSLAETGFVGTTLVVLAGLLPLLTLSRKQLTNPLVAYPLLGCAFVVLYAAIEFPFANGAVFITFWTLFFGAIRYAQLSETMTTSRS